jgi:hypothetical protein
MDLLMGQKVAINEVECSPNCRWARHAGSAATPKPEGSTPPVESYQPGQGSPALETFGGKNGFWVC